jgi:hypothetical protein
LKAPRFAVIIFDMNKIFGVIYAVLCLTLASSCATGRYIVSYDNFAPDHDVVWDWESDPPRFIVRLKSHISDIGGVDPESYEFAVIASGGVIPSETDYDGFPSVNTAGSYWRWIENVYVRLRETPRDTDFPLKLQIIRGGKTVETFNVKLR